MAMHLEGPWMTTTRYSKKPHKKWASSEAKRRALDEEQAWKEKQARWQAEIDQMRAKRAEAAAPLELKPIYPPGREPKVAIPSAPDTVGVAAAAEAKVYTGNNIKGIGTLHKSNAVPIFTDQEAVDIAHMRR